MIENDNEMKAARENLSASEAAAEHLYIALPAKDMEFRAMQRKYDGLNERVARLKTELTKKLNAEIERLRAQVPDLEAINQAESTKANKKLEDSIAFDALIERKMTHHKRMYAILESRLQKVRSHFSKIVIFYASRSDQLKSTVAYFVEEVKRLELGRDILFKSLFDKGYICRVNIDRGNYMAFMETNLDPRPADLIERGRVVGTHKLSSDRPPIIDVEKNLEVSLISSDFTLDGDENLTFGIERPKVINRNGVAWEACNNEWTLPIVRLFAMLRNLSEDEMINLEVHPVKTQVISSGILWGTGDIAAQTITRSTMKKHHKKLNDEEVFKINWKRVAITSMFGVGFVGPVGHFWYEYLDRFMKVQLQLPPKSMRFVAAKVALDGVIFGPLDLCLFFTYMGLTSGKSIPQVKEDLKRDFLPALVLEGGVWPIVQIANFRFIPVRSKKDKADATEDVKGIQQSKSLVRMMKAVMIRTEDGVHRGDLLYDHFSEKEELWFDFMADTGDNSRH
ncbi:hypothetical protein GIB67_009768 [Kingdonia uniflora]|uniref:Uncharacterized protein n=1 Tax=Kingdonia uniflora TaxID=39325 RepID=A0A7J7LXF6_9MAGN|nr:hypothetical protein GIB67_009768 [Kingdonia uniflora]